MYVVIDVILIVVLVVAFFYAKRKGISLNKEEDGKKYVLNAITIDEDGGESSHWHGWNSKWLFTYNEAVEEREKIKHMFTEVEILEHETK